MQLYLSTLLLLVVQQIQRILGQGIPLSPCPKMFQYRFDGNEWFGLLSVRTNDFQQSLQVVLSTRGKPLTNYNGAIELLTRGQFQSDAPVLYKIKFPKVYFLPKLLQINVNNRIVCFGAADHNPFAWQITLELDTQKFFFIPHNVGSLPLQPMTADSSDTLNNFKQLPLHLSQKQLPVSNRDLQPVRNSKNICGRIDERIHFDIERALAPPSLTTSTESKEDYDIDMNAAELQISLGAQLPIFVTAKEVNDHDDSVTAITRGSWPWLAAIYVNNLTSLVYQCGGTLVSARIVISSAHCFELFRKRYSANELLVFLGRHNLKNWNEDGTIAAPVDDIYTHPDYNSNLHNYDADIAVLVLKHEVRFNSFIRPACLWSGASNLAYVIGETGVVVGWGLSQLNSTFGGSSLSTTLPKLINAPIVSNDKCFKANEKFYSLSSNRTFCAGRVYSSSQQAQLQQQQYKQRSGPCSGDSGSGLLIYRNNRWILRGIVSATLPAASGSINNSSSNNSSNSKLSCNENQYVIYTDVSKFLDWINAFLA